MESVFTATSSGNIEIPLSYDRRETDASGKNRKTTIMGDLLATANAIAKWASSILATSGGYQQ